MIVIREKEFMSAIEGLLIAIRSTVTDGNGLKVIIHLDPEKFGAAVLATAGMQSYGEVPYLLPDGADFPVMAFRPSDLTNFMREAAVRSQNET